MKPDGVITTALEPMDALESNPDNDAAPSTGQEPNQAASPVVEEAPVQCAGDRGQGDSKPEKAKEKTPAKTSTKISGDSKAKTTSKTAVKTKPLSQTKTTAGSRPNTSQSRLSNGVSKPQTNGVAKKTTPPLDKKSSASLVPKKPTAPALKSKVGEKKPPGALPTTNGAKSTSGSTAVKKTPSSVANGVKTSTTAAAAKRPPG